MKTHETEAKYRCDDPATLRRRLAELAARPISWVAERNEMYDTPDARLRAAGCGLRLRVATPLDSVGEAKVTLTFKGPRQAVFAAQAVKRREEIELTVSSADAARGILANLGFAPRLLYEKRRESWSLRGCTVTLDELPRCGWFVEIEVEADETQPASSAADSIAALADDLNLPPDGSTPQTYVDMAATHGVTGDDGCCELLWSLRTPD